MKPRSDLLELTPEALTALANLGFVKRAQKDVAEGKLPAIEQEDDGTVIARYGDGVVTSLGPGKPLRDASCNCPASGLCRHRVTLVLAYQAQAAGSGDTAADSPGELWSPAELAQAVLALPPATLEQARRIAAARPVLRLAFGDGVPSARLPMCDVRFFSRSSLAMARCDCQQGGNCAHVVVAVWGFAQAAAQTPNLTDITIELNADEPSDEASSDAAEDAIGALIEQLWMDGTGQPMLALATPFEHALALAGKQQWRWIADLLEQLREAVAGQHARSSRAQPAQLLALLTGLSNRLAAASHARQAQHTPVPASQILGIGIKGEVALDHLRLVPLGAQCWADDSSHGARLVWTDPDTLAVTVLERSWPLAATALHERRLVGQPLHKLARSQVVTRAAKRQANGALSIGAGATQTSVLPLSASGWDTLARPLRQPTLASLRAHLASLAPDFVRSPQAVEHVHVLPVCAVSECGWDGASQTLSAWLQVDPDEDELLLLQLAHDNIAPMAIDALSRALNGEYGTVLAVSGEASIRADQVCMQALAVLTSQGLIVPQLAIAAPHNTAGSACHVPEDELQALLAASRALLAQWLRQGLRHQGGAAMQRANDKVNELRAAGLVHCAGAFDAALEALRGDGAKALPGKLAALHALLDTLANS